MKKTFAAAATLLLVSTVAGSAADMPMKAAPYAPAPVWSWTGFYIGGHVGAGWGTTETTVTGFSAAGFGAFPFDFPLAQNSRSGFLGGGQVGYNFQSGWAVFGVQGDFAGLDVKGTAPCVVVRLVHDEERLAGNGIRPLRRRGSRSRPDLRQGRCCLDELDA